MGRPKSPNITKNRIHSVVLNLKAELIYREISKRIGKGWFSEIVNQAVINYGNKRIEKMILIKELNCKSEQRDKIESEMKDLVNRIGELNE